jgi:hypothetical protein
MMLKETKRIQVDMSVEKCENEDERETGKKRRFLHLNCISSVSTGNLTLPSARNIFQFSKISDM